jgi:hypothetical protein
LGRKAYNEFDGISEGRIEQATQRLAQLGRELFGRKAQQTREWYDGNEIEDEDDGGVPADSAGDDAKRHEDEKHVDIVAREGGPGHLGDIARGLAPGTRAVIGVVTDEGRGLGGSPIRRGGHGTGTVDTESTVVTTKAIELAL